MGIAFQALKQEDAENIGYIIPTPVISHFLSDYERNGNYTGYLLVPSVFQIWPSDCLGIGLGIHKIVKLESLK